MRDKNNNPDLILIDNIEIKKKDCLLYNSINGKFVITKDEALNKIFFNMKKDSNYIYEILDNDKTLQIINLYIQEIKDKYIGDLVKSKNKMVQIIPKFNNQYENARMNINYYEQNIGVDVVNIDRLKKITIYLTGNCDLYCENCDYSFKQVGKCSKEFNKKEINYKKLTNRLLEVKSRNILVELNGGNIYNYSELENLVSFLLENGFQVKLNSYYKNTIFLPSGVFYKIFLDLPIDLNFFNERIVKKIFFYSDKVDFHFLVSSIEDIDQAKEIISEFKLKYYFFKPIFTGRNIEFFKQLMFISNESLENVAVSLKNIYLNQAINSNDFGKFIITNDGDIYTNLNEEKVGNIYNKTFSKLIYEQFENETGWFKTRNKLNDCKNCIFNSICPPPTNYEYLFKENICTIKM